MTTIYGIKNCDTMKKSLKWLEERDVDFTFHDYKKSGIDEGVITQALSEHGWENVINRRGTTWRKLPEDVQAAMNDENAIALAHENASIIKRPLLVHGGKTYLGFKPDIYGGIFN